MPVAPASMMCLTHTQKESAAVPAWICVLQHGHIWQDLTQIVQRHVRCLVTAHDSNTTKVMLTLLAC